jgi:hypothetical protein
VTAIIANMSTVENTISNLPRRPPIGDASAAAILGALALGILTGGLGAALIGGVAGSALASQPQPLEMAIRDHLRRLGYEVIFYYPGPRSVKVTFQYEPNAYWTVESIVPDDLQLSSDDADDWLYGNLVAVELPQVLPRIRRAS